MLLYTMLYIVLAYLMLFAALTNSVCLNNASFFFLFKYFLCQGYELSGEIALKNNHYYYYYYTPCLFSIDLHTVRQHLVIVHFLLLRLLSGTLFQMMSGVPHHCHHLSLV